MRNKVYKEIGMRFGKDQHLKKGVSIKSRDTPDVIISDNQMYSTQNRRGREVSFVRP